MEVESYVYYGIEKVAPRAKFAVNDMIYPLSYSGTELRNDGQSVTPRGANHQELKVDYNFDVYAVISIGGFETGTKLLGYEGWYIIK